MRISQWQWLKSRFEMPNFSEPKSKATRLDATRRRIDARAVFEAAQRLLEFAAARGGADDERAVGDGFGDGRVVLRLP